MKFNAVIGNPPYQTQSKSSMNSIWQYFVEIGNKITEKYSSFIHPARWVVAKTNYKKIRDDMIEEGLYDFDFYRTSSDIFPNTLIDGGISVTNFKKGSKDSINYSVNGKSKGIYNKDALFIGDEYEQEIVDNLCSQYKGKDNIAKRKIGDSSSYGGAEYGYNKTKHRQFLKINSKGMKTPIKIWANGDIGQRGETKKGWFYIEKDKLDDIPKAVKVNKVMIGKIGNSISSRGGNGFNNNPEIVDKNTIGQDVIFIIPEHDTDYELKLIQTLFATKTARFLMSLTQKDLYVRGFENIPDYTYFQSELEDIGDKAKTEEQRAELAKNGYKLWFDESDKKWKGLFSDNYFYDKFSFSDDLIKYIEEHISEKKV